MHCYELKFKGRENWADDSSRSHASSLVLRHEFNHLWDHDDYHGDSYNSLRIRKASHSIT